MGDSTFAVGVVTSPAGGVVGEVASTLCSADFNSAPTFGSLFEDSSLAATEAREAKEVRPLKGICAGVAAGSWKALTTRI